MDENLVSILRKALASGNGEMNTYWSAWAHRALTKDELEALADIGIRPQEVKRVQYEL